MFTGSEPFEEVARGGVGQRREPVARTRVAVPTVVDLTVIGQLGTPINTATRPYLNQQILSLLRAAAL